MDSFDTEVPAEFKKVQCNTLMIVYAQILHKVMHQQDTLILRRSRDKKQETSTLSQIIDRQYLKKGWIKMRMLQWHAFQRQGSVWKELMKGTKSF